MKYDGIRVGQLIRMKRTEHRLTIDELSAELEVSAAHMTQIELGNRKMSVDLLCKLITVLDIDANALLNGDFSKEDSVDVRLAVLPEKSRTYLLSVFSYMINNVATGVA